ncbi:MAG: LysR family transcriptional regulator, partial [Candidatus Binatia bacterium]
MTLYQLQVFTTVAKLKSFTLAGKKLSVRQPSVSLMVGELGREVGAKLFERFGAKVRLTNAGKHLLHRAEEILARAEEAKERIHQITGLEKGRVIVGGSALAGASFLPAAVQAFKGQYPDFEVILRLHKSESLEKELLEGRIDVALTGRLPTSSLLIAEHFCEEEVIVIAPPKHPLAKMRTVPLELIANEPLVIQKKGRLVRDLVEREFVEKGLPFAGALEIDAPFSPKDAIKRAVASGLGLGFLCREYVAADLEAGRIEALRVPELQIKRPIYRVVHKS